MTKITVKYEARLNRNIKRSPYGLNKIYKKGTVIWSCSENKFKKLTKKNIINETDLCICEGHGVYEYFDLDNDIEFVRIETVKNTNETIIKLKK